MRTLRILVTFRFISCASCLFSRWPRARPLADALDGGFAQWHRCSRIAAGVPGWRADSGERRQRRGCGHRYQRRNGRRRAHDERHRRRFIRDCLRREGQQTLWIERQRLGAQRFNHRISAQERHARYAAEAGFIPITVPGAVDGWQKLADRFGRKKLADDLAPAIRHRAATDFRCPRWDRVVLGCWKSTSCAATAPRRKRIFIKDRPPKIGEIFRNADLRLVAAAAIAAHGRDAFYKGEIATKMLDTMKRHNGVMTAQDLSEYSAEWVEPISTTYRDWTVYELPPNGQGIAALEMLNIMEKFPLGQSKEWGFGSVNALHTMIEAKKLAYADLRQYIGEPRGQKLPVSTLTFERVGRPALQTDRSRARQLRRRAPANFPPGTDTTYLTVVDREGNMVSLIQSNYDGFRLRDRGAPGRVSCCTTAAASSRSTPRRPTRWRDASGRCTPSFRRSRRKATPAWPSASWAGGISRRPTRNSSPIFPISR